MKLLENLLTGQKQLNGGKIHLLFLLLIIAAEFQPKYRLIPLELFKIPMLWMGGALSETGIKIEKTGSQVDIPLTLLNQLGLKESFPFGKDLLSDSSGSFAFYTYNEGFGFITDSSSALYDHKLKPLW